MRVYVSVDVCVYVCVFVRVDVRVYVVLLCVCMCVFYFIDRYHGMTRIRKRQRRNMVSVMMTCVHDDVCA